MAARSIKAGLGIVSALVASTLLVPTAAHADYAPAAGDVVGVGSDTLQQVVNFVGDGDFLGDSGYNGLGGKNKFISVDATADANSRLAYSSGGVSGSCAPGTGGGSGSVGTGNQNSNHADNPCTLNPTVVLRSGNLPQQRPNGSGAGFKLLRNDTTAAGKSANGLVDFARASSGQNPSSNPDAALFDRLTIGSDPLQILASTTTHAVSLTAAQLKAVYECQPNARTWDQVGGSSTDSILPLLPQLGSGTRSAFLKAIGTTEALVGAGNCTRNVEENDPEAIDAAASPANAVEPMSASRLNLFQGKFPDGTPTGAPGYFNDPSCPFPPNVNNPVSQGSGANASNCDSAPTLSPNVKLLTDKTPSGAAAFVQSRSLYIYFRHADLNSTKKFQPGGALNWVRTMLYNPCPSGATCTPSSDGNTYGPGGAPYFAQAGTQALIRAAGITPDYAYKSGAD